MVEQQQHQDSPARQQGRGGKVLRLVLPMVVLAIGVGVAAWMVSTTPEAKPRPKGRRATLVEVKKVVFEPQPTMVSVMGTVTPARQIDLMPQVGGEVLSVSGEFVPGGLFAPGDEILQIDPADYRLAVRQLTSEVARARAEIQLEEGNQLVARREYELLGEPVSEVEEALMLRRPQLDSLEAMLQAAEAKLQQARLDLGRTTIGAPFSAVVQSREVNVGTRVNQGSVMASLVGTDHYWVEVSVPVHQLRWIRIPGKNGDAGSSVRMYDPSTWPAGAYRQGRVIRLAADLEEQGRMARLLVEVDDPLALNAENRGKQRLLIGSFLRVEIEGKLLDAAVAIDREHVRDGDRVWIMNGAGTLEIRPVEIAFRGRDTLLVAGGLAEGDQLVVSDLSAAVSGMPLRLRGGSPEEKLSAAKNGAAETGEAAR